MIIKTFKTPKVVPGKKNNLFKILDQHLPSLEEKDIVVITSKIIGLCQGRVVRNDGSISKKDLIRKESEYYLEEECLPKYGIILTIKKDLLIASAGIDESNGNGYFILWPENLQKTVNNIRKYLRKKCQLKYLGLIITDSRTIPLRRGVTGLGLAHSGFYALNSYIGARDIFGRELHFTVVNVLDGIAGAAALVMGEGKEQTPLAVIKDTPFVKFKLGDPSPEELKELRIPLKDDLYAPLISSAKWKKGGSQPLKM